MEKFEFEFNYGSITLEEIDSYQHFEFVCDGDSKKVIALEK